MDDVESLKNRIEQLEKENDYLKSLLIKAGISFEPETIVDKANAYDPDQGSRIIPKTDFTEEDANQFFKMFWGRTDVYSKRTVVKPKGTANYYPQCYKFWKSGCPKRTDKRKQCSACTSPAYIPLGVRRIIAHLKGLSKETEDVIGVYPLLPDDTCRFIVFDFDNHEEGADKHDYSSCGFPELRDIFIGAVPIDSYPGKCRFDFLIFLFCQFDIRCAKVLHQPFVTAHTGDWDDEVLLVQHPCKGKLGRRDPFFAEISFSISRSGWFAVTLSLENLVMTRRTSSPV